ncbi:MAG TPA: c-type cytochrome biogenesis protein CcmI, partial [Rhodopila sp.]|uniref:c-type cytochrome biogenesis protein CcmI n=1 Tax=Rhodopila sp. TaxID=2480087 RepID=UPI002C932141
MILAFLFALLAFLSLLPILKPLMTGSRPVPDRSQFDQAVYRDQLQELDRDIARGLISATEAETARIEIQRRLLAASREPSRQVRLTRSPAMAAFVLALVGGGSVLAYVYLGSPDLPDIPFSAQPRETANSPREQMRKAVDQLAEQVRQNPKDGGGWLRYARGLAALGDWGHAEAAYRQAIALGQDSPDIEADHAEMLVMQTGGTVTPAAEAAFRNVLSADQGNAMARYYLALAHLQAGEPRKAIDGLQGLLAILPSNSPLRDRIGRQIAQAAKTAGLPMPKLAEGSAPTPTGTPPGPTASQEAQAAQMPAAQREAMIRGMVASLAAKQEADPGNFDGWMRLGRAYAVLNEPDKAAAAYDKAQALRPDDLSVP